MGMVWAENNQTDVRPVSCWRRQQDEEASRRGARLSGHETPQRIVDCIDMVKFRGDAIARCGRCAVDDDTPDLSLAMDIDNLKRHKRSPSF